MEVSGKIIAILPQQSGMGKNGQWRSQDYVLETADQYPKKVCFNLFNDKIEKFPIAIGDTVNISFDIESREYNGRWYTSVKAWKVEKAGGDMQDRMPDYDVAQNTPNNGGIDLSVSEGDDLPF